MITANYKISYFNLNFDRKSALYVSLTYRKIFSNLNVKTKTIVNTKYHIENELISLQNNIFYKYEPQLLSSSKMGGY